MLPGKDNANHFAMVKDLSQVYESQAPALPGFDFFGSIELPLEVCSVLVYWF